MPTRLTRYAPLLAVLGLFAGALALHAHTAFGAEAPEQALRVSLEARGTAYAGDCGATVAPRDIGAACSRLAGERGGVRAYLVGRTFGEFSHWLFLGRAGNADWRVLAEQPLDLASDSPEIPWP